MNLSSRDYLRNGKEAEAMDLILKAVPADKLDDAVKVLAKRIRTTPINQIWIQERVIENISKGYIASGQQLAVIFDGLTQILPNVWCSSSWQPLRASRRLSSFGTSPEGLKGIAISGKAPCDNFAAL